MSQSVPQERIRIFNRERYPIAEFRASVERSWALGDEGRAQFSYPSRKTDIVNQKVLQYGNYILVESTALPPWVGVIDTPREWSAQKVTVKAYSPEKIFSWRRGPLERVFTNTPAGSLFEYLVNLVNAAQPTALKLGNVWKGGQPRQETFNPNPLSEELRRIQERSLEDYTFRPLVEADGRLTIFADWYLRVGFDYDVLLHQGRHGGNIETVDRIMIEDGDIANDILGYGEGITWVSKPASIIVDPPSIQTYGLRQSSISYDGVTTVNGVSNNLVEEISNTKNPVNRFEINAINVGDTFKYVGIGNSLKLQLQNVGFQNGSIGYQARVRIIGMSYNPENAKNKIKLIVEEV